MQSVDGTRIVAPHQSEKQIIDIERKLHANEHSGLNIDLQSCWLGDKKLVEIVSCLNQNKRLLSLNLSDNRLHFPGMMMYALPQSFSYRSLF